MQFPSEAEIKEIIARLDSYKWPIYSSDNNPNEFALNILNKLRSEFGILPYLYRIFDPDKFTFKMFRARKYSEISDLGLISEFSYCPRNLVSDIGRCHFPKLPVFYCANDSLTSIIEILRDKNPFNQIYCLSSWGVNHSNYKINAVPFLGDLPKESLYLILKKNYYTRINEHFDSKLNGDQVEAAKLFIDYFSNSFLSSNYSLSASIAFGALYGEIDHRPQILMYQSYLNPKNGFNLAINPNFVDQHMYLKSILILDLKGFDKEQNRINFTPLSLGTPTGSYINWNNNLDETNIKEIEDEFFGEPIR